MSIGEAFLSFFGYKFPSDLQQVISAENAKFDKKSSSTFFTDDKRTMQKTQEIISNLWTSPWNYWHHGIQKSYDDYYWWGPVSAPPKELPEGITRLEIKFRQNISDREGLTVSYIYPNGRELVFSSRYTFTDKLHFDYSREI